MSMGRKKKITPPSEGEEALSIVFDYSNIANNYYFASSEPECYSNSEYQGKVYFQLDGKQDASHSFSVHLEPYHQIQLMCDNRIRLEDALTSTSVNGVEMPIISDVISHIKPGDKIRFTMGRDYKITCNQVEFHKEALKDGCIFSFEMPDISQGNDGTSASRLDFRIQRLSIILFLIRDILIKNAITTGVSSIDDLKDKLSQLLSMFEISFSARQRKYFSSVQTHHASALVSEISSRFISERSNTSSTSSPFRSAAFQSARCVSGTASTHL